MCNQKTYIFNWIKTYYGQSNDLHTILHADTVQCFFENLTRSSAVAVIADRTAYSHSL